jgi:hypothetical protein
MLSGIAPDRSHTDYWDVNMGSRRPPRGGE